MDDLCHRSMRSRLQAALACAALALAGAGCANMMEGSKAAASQPSAPTLSGANEVPAVTTAATGRSMIVVHPNRAVSGSVSTTGLNNATMAHIHVGAPGANGPVIVPLVRGDGGSWTVPAGAMLTEDQFASWRAGNLYVNVHSAAFPGGEIRAQLRP